MKGLVKTKVLELKRTGRWQKYVYKFQRGDQESTVALRLCSYLHTQQSVTDTGCTIPLITSLNSPSRAFPSVLLVLRAITHPLSSALRVDTTETVTNPIPSHPVADTIESYKPPPAYSIPWRGFLIGGRCSETTVACCVCAFLAAHFHVCQRAQRRFDPNRDLTLHDSRLLAP
jgi:hypothetical protein